MTERLKKLKTLLGGQKIQRIMIVALFGLIFLFGMLCVFDYGLSWDEPFQRNHSLYNYAYAFDELFDIHLDREAMGIGEIDIQEYNRKFYGVAVQMPLVAIEHAFNFTLPIRTVFHIRHVFTFCVQFIGLICFYRLCKKLIGSRLFSMLGTLTVFLSPRIFAQAFYNIKDSLFAAMFIITLYVAVQFLTLGRKPGWALLTGFLIALSTNQRILGVALIFAVLGLMVLEDITLFVCKKKQFSTETLGVEKSSGRNQWLAYFILLASFILLYFAITPVSWQNPLRFTFDYFTTFIGYDEWNNEFLFNGRMMTKYDTPWFYLPLWLAMTLPIVTLLFMAIGAIWLLADSLRKGLPGILRNRYLLVILACGGLPALAGVLKPSLMYVDWRHVFFIYPPFIVGAVYGAYSLYKWMRKKQLLRARVAVPALIACSLLAQLGWIIRNHPYEYVYYNAVSRRLMPRFRRDYWGLSYKQALDYIAANNSGEVTILCKGGPWDNYWRTADPKTRERLIGRSWEVDIEIEGRPEIYDDFVISLYTDTTDASFELDGYEKYWEQAVNGTPIITVLKRVE